MDFFDLFISFLEIFLENEVLDWQRSGFCLMNWCYIMKSGVKVVWIYYSQVYKWGKCIEYYFILI